jgi:pantoate kinase
MTWTTAQDVLDRWVGGEPPVSNEVIEVLIGDAENVIKSEYPKIQDRIDADELDVSVVVMVATRMVSRLLRNPDIAGYVQQSTGPFAQSINFGQNIDIFMGDNEKQLLAPKRGKKAFEIDLGSAAVSPTTLDPIWELSEGN